MFRELIHIRELIHKVVDFLTLADLARMRSVSSAFQGMCNSAEIRMGTGLNINIRLGTLGTSGFSRIERVDFLELGTNADGEGVLRLPGRLQATETARVYVPGPAIAIKNTWLIACNNGRRTLEIVVRPPDPDEFVEERTSSSMLFGRTILGSVVRERLLDSQIRVEGDAAALDGLREELLRRRTAAERGRRPSAALVAALAEVAKGEGVRSLVVPPEPWPRAYTGGVPHTAASLFHLAAWIGSQPDVFETIAFAPAEPPAKQLETVGPPAEALAALSTALGGCAALTHVDLAAFLPLNEPHTYTSQRFGLCRDDEVDGLEGAGVRALLGALPSGVGVGGLAIPLECFETVAERRLVLSSLCFREPFVSAPDGTRPAGDHLRRLCDEWLCAPRGEQLRSRLRSLTLHISRLCLPMRDEHDSFGAPEDGRAVAARIVAAVGACPHLEELVLADVEHPAYGRPIRGYYGTRDAIEAGGPGKLRELDIAVAVAFAALLKPRSPLPASFLASAIPTRAEYEASLRLPHDQRAALERRHVGRGGGGGGGGRDGRRSGGEVACAPPAMGCGGRLALVRGLWEGPLERSLATATAPHLALRGVDTAALGRILVWLRAGCGTHLTRLGLHLFSSDASLPLVREKAAGASGHFSTEGGLALAAVLTEGACPDLALIDLTNSLVGEAARPALEAACPRATLVGLVSDKAVEKDAYW